MASKRRLRRRGCEGKKAYEDQLSAERAAFDLRCLQRQDIRAYRCPWGNHWHVGHHKGKWIRR